MMNAAGTIMTGSGAGFHDEPHDPPTVPVSIIVTTFRRREFVHEAVRSALIQDAQSDQFEVLVTASGPIPQIRDLEGAERLQVINVDAANYGQELATGIRASRGQVLCLLDDDDAFVRGKVRIVSEVFRTDPRLGFYSNSFDVIDRSGTVLRDHPFRRRSRQARRALGPVRVEGPGALDDLARFPPLSPDFNHSSISVRRTVVDPVLDALERVPVSADTFLFYAALRAGAGIRLDPAPLTHYRIYGESVSNPNVEHPDLFLHRLYEHAEKVIASYRIILDMLSGSSPALIHGIEDAIQFEEVYAVLRNDSKRRRSMWAALRPVLHRQSRYVWKAERPIVPLALLYLVSPALARRSYLHAKSRELSRAAVAG